MGRHVLVYVEPDTASQRELASVAAGETYDIVPCTTAKGALNATLALEPDCLITELSLPDKSGHWLTGAIRAHSSRISLTPILVVSKLWDEATQIRTLAGGADCYVTKPFDPVSLLAQIGGLVRLASRIRARKRHSMIPREELPQLPPGERAAISGSVRKMSVPAVLTALELERRSGTLTLIEGSRRSPTRVMELRVTDGVLVAGLWHGARLAPVDAMIAALESPATRYEFTPGSCGVAPTNADRIGALVMKAIYQIEKEVTGGSRGGLSAGPRKQSGTRAKVIPPPDADKLNAGGSTRDSQPKRALLESMAPAADRSVAETSEGDDDTTQKLASA